MPKTQKHAKHCGLVHPAYSAGCNSSVHGLIANVKMVQVKPNVDVPIARNIAAKLLQAYRCALSA